MIRELPHVPCRRQEHLLQNVLHFHRATQLRAHLVMHQHRQPPLILPEDQAEGLGVSSFESLYEIVRGRLGAHLLPTPACTWNASYSNYTLVWKQASTPHAHPTRLPGHNSGT